MVSVWEIVELTSPSTMPDLLKEFSKKIIHEQRELDKKLPAAMGPDNFFPSISERSFKCSMRLLQDDTSPISSL